MRNQLTKWRPRLGVPVCADEEFPRRSIGAVEFELMRPVIRQTTVQIFEQADEIEQRRDIRIRLAVVVAEEALVIADQARVCIRGDDLIVARESSRSREFHGPVIAPGMSKTSYRRISARFVLGRLAMSPSSGIEQKIMVTVIKGPILDNVHLGAIDASRSQNKILYNFVIETGRPFIHCLRS